jgi:hypothetical protein
MSHFVNTFCKRFALVSAAAFALQVAIAAETIAAETIAAPKPPAGSASQLPQKLPAKKKTTKRTLIDISDSAGVVIAPKNPSLNKAIQKSELQKNDAEVRVQSRVFVPAPPGDLSEIPRAEIPSSKTVVKPVAAIPPAATPPPNKAEPVATPAPLPPVAKVEELPATPPVVLPPIPIEPMGEFTQPDQSAQSATPEEDENVEAPVGQKISTAAPTEARIETSKETTPQTLAFARYGYLQAKYGKFDSRMKDGATYVGLGVAREFETTWGSFEARASMDAYHAMDQSVTVDNIRMLATRTEVGYWFTRTRVRPGISLGLGWTDYSVRSYRSIGSSTDPSNQTVVLKTHAKSQAFTVIPGTSLRIEVADGLVIDTQTEFLGILGGDSADSVQGLSFGVALGWIF